MPDRAQRDLPRFEVVRVGQQYCAYDYLTRISRWAADPRDYDATARVVASLAAEARRKGEPLALPRTETPPAKRPPPRRPK